MNKPFFSIIIPTYNPRNYLPTLLESISHNNCLDKIEVIISDDISTEPFDDILEQFPMLNIMKIENKKHYGFPRVGRQNGADNAHGEWFCFADQDDYFLPNSFDNIYTMITENKVTNYLMTNFLEKCADSDQMIIRDKHSGWTHGKFYQTSFWKHYKISYDNVQYCEDINLTNKIDCIILSHHALSYETNNCVYVWKRRKDSLSDIEYFKKSMSDYIKATSGVTLKYVEKYIEDGQLAKIFKTKFIGTIYHIFFYYQSEVLNTDKTGLLKAMQTLQPIYTRFKEVTRYSTDDIIRLTNTELLGVYNKTRAGDYNQIPFVEQIAFGQWLKLYLE